MADVVEALELLAIHGVASSVRTVADLQSRQRLRNGAPSVASGYGTERFRSPAATERSAFGRKKGRDQRLCQLLTLPQRWLQQRPRRIAFRCPILCTTT